MKLVRAVTIWFWVGAAAAAAADKLPASSPDSVVISVSEDGTILWNGSPVSCEEVHKRLLAMAEKSGRPVSSKPCAAGFMGVDQYLKENPRADKVK
jgi:hypothetical protein